MERDTYHRLHFCFAMHFNSRAHVERDLRHQDLYLVVDTFQLTRSRGARLEDTLKYASATVDFNSRAHVERD